MCIAIHIFIKCLFMQTTLKSRVCLIRVFSFTMCTICKSCIYYLIKHYVIVDFRRLNDNFVCFPFRLAGYENTLLGYRPRIYSTIKSLLKEDKDAIDVLMFGKQ